jgi:hypothetical protein
VLRFESAKVRLQLLDHRSRANTVDCESHSAACIRLHRAHEPMVP